MAVKWKIGDIKDDFVVAYYDLEFCNECETRRNFPIAIGASYRRGSEEIASYESLIWCGDERKLWKEQLDRIGYDAKTLRKYGKPMEEITEEILAANEEYQPLMYVSFGRQDSDLLKKHATRSLEHFAFRDGIKFLSKRLLMKCEISLEKYSYICGLDFVHEFLPLADARCLADVIWCVLGGHADENRRQEVAKEYEGRMFVSQYKNKLQAHEYLSGLSELTPRQQEKMHLQEEFLEKNRERFAEYMDKFH